MMGDNTLPVDRLARLDGDHHRRGRRTTTSCHPDRRRAAVRTIRGNKRPMNLAQRTPDRDETPIALPEREQDRHDRRVRRDPAAQRQDRLRGGPNPAWSFLRDNAQTGDPNGEWRGARRRPTPRASRSCRARTSRGARCSCSIPLRPFSWLTGSRRGPTASAWCDDRRRLCSCRPRAEPPTTVRAGEPRS